MEKKKSLHILFFAVLLFLVVGCSAGKNEIKTAQIKQVLNNKDSLQETASYQFDNGKLDVSLTFLPFSNPNVTLPDTEYDQKVEDEIKRINKEFPNEKVTEDSFNNSFTKSLKNITFTADKESKKVIISGKDIKKEFKMSESNENYLTDDSGIEYEVTYDK